MLSANADQLSLHMQTFESWQQRQEGTDRGDIFFVFLFKKGSQEANKLRI